MFQIDYILKNQPVHVGWRRDTVYSSKPSRHRSVHVGRVEEQTNRIPSHCCRYVLDDCHCVPLTRFTRHNSVEILRVGITSMLRSRQNLEIGEWATIVISRNTETQESRLSVNGETPIRSIENGNMYALELKTHLFVGGYDSYKVKIAKPVDVETNFRGCIKMVTPLDVCYYCYANTSGLVSVFTWYLSRLLA